MYKVGDVFKSSKKYTSTGREAKCRWFVFLGRTNWANNPRNIFLCTTTTQMRRYEESKKFVCVKFQASDSCFEADCLMCLDEIEDNYSEKTFAAILQPVKKGRISDEKLKEIAKKIKSADLPKAIIDDILQSFKADGIPTR